MNLRNLHNLRQLFLLLLMAISVPAMALAQDSGTFATDTPAEVVDIDPPIVAVTTPASDLANSALNFAGVTLVVGLGFALVMVAIFIMVIAPKLERMVPVEYAGVIGAVKTGTLNKIDGGLAQLQDILDDNEIVWDDEVIKSFRDIVQKWKTDNATQRL